MIKNIKKNKNGYALLELLFYIAFFAVLTIVVINAMITMAKSFKETSIQAELAQSGTIMERISREIRQASGINSINPAKNDLILSTSGTDTIIEFKWLDQNNFQLWEKNAVTGNNNLTGNLNTPNIIVTSVVFNQITTAKSNAVQIILTIKSADDTLSTPHSFNDTVVLRGSYQ